MPSLRELRHRVGELAIVGFDGHTVPGGLRALAHEFDLGGVILFARNVDTPHQVAELAGDVQTMRRELPLWVSVDQEGGRVARLRAPFTEWPPMITLGRSGGAAERLATRFATALAAELRAVGVTLDFAPVLDVHTNPSNPVIGDRALSETASDVARIGQAIIRALQGNGIAACGKHFPGHGDTSVDSHFDLPVVEHPPDRLRAVELVPFRAAVEADVASIMTAHVLIPALDAERPATLSRRVVDDLLRRELAFDGLVFSDDLEMKAVAARYTREQSAVGAIVAGCDAVLLCGTDHDAQASALEALVHAMETGELPLTQVEDSLTRHRRAKERFLADVAWRVPKRQELDGLIGRGEHRAIAEEMARFL